jgi:hypothetical protein
MLKNKPSWAFWLLWIAAYAILDTIADLLWQHGHLSWAQAPGLLEGAIAGASLTWFFALWRWYKAQDRF